MPTKQVPIKDATATQLKQFARLHLGLQTPQSESRDKLEARIREVHADTTIPVEVEDDAAAAPPVGAPPPPATPAQEAVVEAKARKLERIQIARQDGNGGDRPVPVSVNGKTMLIPRGEPVAVPEEYAEALRNAKQTVYDKNSDESLGEAREVPAYPVSYLGAA